MDTLFYSPNGVSWNMQGPEVQTDRYKIVTMKVRRYTYRNTQYTILACAEMKSIDEVFYQLEIRRPRGESFPSTPDGDFKVIKGLLEYATLTIDDYKATENRLFKKIANKRQEDFVENMKVTSITTVD